MEPRIQYAQSSDGVSIAYWTMGDGAPPLVMTAPIQWSHISLELQVPELRQWYQRLAGGRMLVRYDPRGSGMSQRDVEDHSVERQTEDLEAVLASIGADQIDLVGFFSPGAQALKFAADQPDRVGKLVLWGIVARPDSFYGSPRGRALFSLVEQDWELFTETIAQALLDWRAGRQAHDWAAFIRQSTTPGDQIRLNAALKGVDFVSFLPQVRAQTLVISNPHTADEWLGDPNVASTLASGIAGARLAVMPGLQGPPWESAEGTAEMEAFLGMVDAAVAEPPSAGLVTILFTDIESSTSTRQHVGDAKAQEFLHVHNTIVRDALRRHSGIEIKHTGDGIMASFSSATAALESAVAIQRAVAAHNEEQPDSPLGVYIGLNAGEPIAEDHDLFGTSVDLARRICDHARSGQILPSDVERQLAAGKTFRFADLGEA